MKIIHLIDSIKPGGAESVMCNYIKVCNELGGSSVVIGAPDSKKYESTLSEIAVISYTLTKEILSSADVVFVHSNHGLISLVRHVGTLGGESHLYSAS